MPTQPTVLSALREAKTRVATLISHASAHVKAKINAYSFARGLRGQPTPEFLAKMAKLEAAQRKTGDRLTADIAAIRTFLAASAVLLPKVVADLVTEEVDLGGLIWGFAPGSGDDSGIMANMKKKYAELVKVIGR